MTTERHQQVELLEALLQDQDFEHLEALAQQFNLFEVLRTVRQEIRHSHFLAWLMDPSRNQGVGDYFVRQFLWKTTSLARAQRKDALSPIDIDALDLKSLDVRREWRGIDILLNARDQAFVCAIENKVDAGEHGDQLKRYADICRREFPDCTRHLVFLSANGAEPSEKDWVAVDYSHIAELIERTLQARMKSIEEEVALFLRHYVSMLRRHIVGESEIQELCQKIYSRHGRALDLLFENRPDMQAELRRILEAVISEDPDFDFEQGSGKTYINFFPRSWTSPQLRTAGEFGWILKLMFQNRPDSLTLYLEIMPGDAAVRARIHEAAQSSPIFSRTKLAPVFCRIFRRGFLGAADYEQPLEWLEDQIRQKMDAFKRNDFPQIDKVIQGIDFSLVP